LNGPNIAGSNRLILNLLNTKDTGNAGKKISAKRN
jgi:hypothetical protein